MSRLAATIKAIFSISEICVEESKSHISSENAIKAIRELLGQTQAYTELKRMYEELTYYRNLDKQGRLRVQVHGQWDIFTDEYDCEYMLCTACGEKFYPVDEDTVDMTYNYCPNCGAKMEEEAGE